MSSRPLTILAASAVLFAGAGALPTAEAAVTAPTTTPLAMKIKFFQTPSGNIRCGIVRSGGKWSMRCDIYEHDWVAPKRPTPCGFGDYGSSAGMRRKGWARFICVSDAMDSGKTLNYGKSLSYGPFFCKSRHKGLKCFNARGHGWFLSRETYRFF